MNNIFIWCIFHSFLFCHLFFSSLVFLFLWCVLVWTNMNARHMYTILNAVWIFCLLFSFSLFSYVFSVCFEFCRICYSVWIVCMQKCGERGKSVLFVPKNAHIVCFDVVCSSTFYLIFYFVYEVRCCDFKMSYLQMVSLLLYLNGLE